METWFGKCCKTLIHNHGSETMKENTKDKLWQHVKCGFNAFVLSGISNQQNMLLLKQEM